MNYVECADSSQQLKFTSKFSPLYATSELNDSPIYATLKRFVEFATKDSTSDFQQDCMQALKIFSVLW